MEQSLYELLRYIRGTPKASAAKRRRKPRDYRNRTGCYIVAYTPKGRHSKRRIYGRYDDYNSALYDLGKLRGHKQWKSHIYTTSWEVIS